jgi:hypothetical protein
VVLLEVVNESTAEKNKIRARLGLPPLVNKDREDNRASARTGTQASGERPHRRR